MNNDQYSTCSRLQQSDKVRRKVTELNQLCPLFMPNSGKSADCNPPGQGGQIYSYSLVIYSQTAEFVHNSTDHKNTNSYCSLIYINSQHIYNKQTSSMLTQRHSWCHRSSSGHQIQHTTITNAEQLRVLSTRQLRLYYFTILIHFHHQ